MARRRRNARIWPDRSRAQAHADAQVIAPSFFSTISTRFLAKPVELRRAFLCALAALCLCSLVACRSGKKDFDNENDALRRELEETRAELDRLKAERGEWESKVTELSRVIESGAGGPQSDVLLALPRCAGISIGRLSGPVDEDADQVPDVIDIYIRPFDGRQRFVQVAGKLTLDAVLIPLPAPSSETPAEPVTLARAVLGPQELREAYRSSPLGTHYTIRLPLPAEHAARPGTLVIRAEFLDGITGQSHATTHNATVESHPRP